MTTKNREDTLPRKFCLELRSHHNIAEFRCCLCNDVQRSPFMRQVAVLTEQTLDGVRTIGEVCTVCLKAGPLAAADRARKLADWLSLRAELLRLDVGHLEDMDADNWNAVVKELDVLSQ